MITFPNLGYLGRLGNQLFQIAGTMGIAKARGEEFSLPAWEYAPYFTMPDHFFSGLKGTDAGDIPEHLDPRTRRFLQDISLFENIAEDIKYEHFMCSDYANDLLSKYTDFWNVPETISLHVRRGDNASRENGDLYYPLPTLKYYHEALEQLPDVPVLVFSDEPEWCLENFVSQFPANDMTVITGSITRPETPLGGQNPEPPMDWTDMALMALCDYHIIANSSYSWWGAWLAESYKVFYPTSWYGPAIAEYADYKLIIPNDWIGIDN